jgi:hypothetical protein
MLESVSAVIGRSCVEAAIFSRECPKVFQGKIDAGLDFGDDR